MKKFILISVITLMSMTSYAQTQFTDAQLNCRQFYLLARDYAHAKDTANAIVSLQIALDYYVHPMVAEVYIKMVANSHDAQDFEIVAAYYNREDMIVTYYLRKGDMAAVEKWRRIAKLKRK